MRHVTAFFPSLKGPLPRICGWSLPPNSWSASQELCGLQERLVRAPALSLSCQLSFLRPVGEGRLLFQKGCWGCKSSWEWGARAGIYHPEHGKDAQQ